MKIAHAFLGLLWPALASAQLGPGPAPGSGGTPGNPTATAGPSAINGSATTLMRSDAAPAVQTATTGQLGLVKPDGVNIVAIAGTLSLNYPLDNTQTVAFSVGSSQMGKTTPVAIVAGGTITLPLSGFGSSYFIAGQTWCAVNTATVADTITNSTGATMSPAFTSLAPKATICFQTDGVSNIVATYTPSDPMTLSTAGQVLTGGVHPTAFSNGTATSGTTTVDCGNGMIQTLTNGGAFTLAMSANDGQCTVRVTNNGSAGAITFSGFSEGSNTGDALTTTSTNKFDVTLSRIGGSPHYLVSALQ